MNKPSDTNPDKILLLYGLSVEILFSLSYRSHLGKTLKHNLNYFDKQELLADLQNAVDWIHENINSEAITSWLITPAYPVGSYRLKHPDKYGIADEPITSDEMYNMISMCVQSRVNGNVDLIVPIGTAIQNARHTSFVLKTYLPRLTAQQEMFTAGWKVKGAKTSE